MFAPRVGEVASELYKSSDVCRVEDISRVAAASAGGGGTVEVKEQRGEGRFR